MQTVNQCLCYCGRRLSESRQMVTGKRPGHVFLIIQLTVHFGEPVPTVASETWCWLTGVKPDVIFSFRLFTLRFKACSPWLWVLCQIKLPHEGGSPGTGLVATSSETDVHDEAGNLRYLKYLNQQILLIVCLRNKSYSVHTVKSHKIPLLSNSTRNHNQPTLQLTILYKSLSSYRWASGLLNWTGLTEPSISQRRSRK